MCFLLLLVFLGPRVVIALSWLARPERWERVYDTFLLPFIGFLVAPWTTLMYLLVGLGGLNGLDWFLIGLAAIVDVASLAGGGGYGLRARSR